MRVATARHWPNLGGFALLISGAALVALSIALLLSSGGGSSTPAAGPSVTDPLISTNASVSFWETRLHSDPADFTAANRLASAYIQRGRETGDISDYTRAQSAVDASLKSLPGQNYTGYALKAYLENVRHDFATSLTSAQFAATQNTIDEYAPSVIGDDYIALGRYDDAFQTYSNLVQQFPDLSTFSRMAQIYEIRGDLPNAEGAWKNALELDFGTNPETTAWAHTNYGTFLFNQNRLSDASAQYAEALVAYPGYIHALAGQANVAAATGDYDGSIALYKQVTTRQPLPQYVAALGDVYSVAGQADQATRQYALIAAIEQLYQSNGVNVDMQQALFLADHDQNPGDAVRQALAVREAQPGSIYTADAVAWALYKGGRATDALPYALAALAEGTRDARLFYHAGLIEKALGHTDAARSDLQTAVSINPHFSPLQAPITQQALSELGG
jgi:tetratricopeptide (TPR) repeat protein